MVMLLEWKGCRSRKDSSSGLDRIISRVEALSLPNSKSKKTISQILTVNWCLLLCSNTLEG